jgi:ribosomal protein L16
MKLLSPKKFKYKKLHNIFYKTKNFIKFKFLATYVQLIIFSINTGYLTAKHLETFRLFLRRTLKSGTNIKINITTFPDLSLTKKSAGLRMGKGKGKPYIWVSKIKKGSSIFNIRNSIKYIKWDDDFFNIPIEFVNTLKNKSLRYETPFSDRIDIETAFSEAFKLPFKKENDPTNIIDFLSLTEDFVFNYFLRCNSIFNMEKFLQLYIYINYNLGAFNNNKFFLRDNIILKRFYNKGLKKFPLKTSFMKLNNNFFLYN